jgi:hypothetical protein
MRWILLLLFVSMSGPSLAGGYALGAWHVDIEGALPETYTASDSGATFGLLCTTSGGTCAYYLRTQNTCDEGATIPILASAKGGALHVLGSCTIFNDAGKKVHVLALTPDADLEKAIQSGGNIGFALSLIDGQFKVFRFNLTGASGAVARVRKAASQPSGDQVL